MSIYQQKAACDDEPITQVTLVLSEDGRGFAEAPSVVCGRGITPQSSKNPRVHHIVSPTGFRGIETFHDVTTRNVIQVNLYPNSAEPPIVVGTRHGQALTTAHRGVRLVRSMGFQANRLLFSMDRGRLQEMRFDYATSRSGKTRDVIFWFDTEFLLITGFVLLFLIVLMAAASRRRRPVGATLSAGVGVSVPVYEL